MMSAEEVLGLSTRCEHSFVAALRFLSFCLAGFFYPISCKSLEVDFRLSCAREQGVCLLVFLEVWCDCFRALLPVIKDDLQDYGNTSKSRCQNSSLNR